MAGVTPTSYTPTSQGGVPNLPASDLASMVDWRVPVQYDEQGRPYQTTYSGARFYLNDGSQGTPQNSFTTAYQWNPSTGQYDTSMNAGGLGGAIEGAGALAAPLLVGPALADAFGGGAAAGAGAAGDGVLPSSAIGGYATPGAVTASGVGDAAAGLVPSSAIGGYSLPSAVLSSGTDAATTGGSMSFLDSLFPDLIKTGGGIIGSIISTHGNTEAAKIAAQAAQQALDFEKQQYAAKQQALSPYGNVGAGAIGALGSAYGLTGAQAPTAASAAKPVLMRAPNGITKVVSSADAAHYQSLGATLLGDA